MSSTTERKLAAIMFTDIAGYTSQMSKDQDVALSMLDTKRKALKPLIQKHKGTLVKEMGDGTLSHFSSAIDATNCSLDLQKSLKDNNDLNIRIGVHLGDTSFRDDDVFGDGVNIASRLEKMSPPGGILVSKNIYDELLSRKGYDGMSLGLQSMKGVGRLIEVFALKDKYLTMPKIDEYKNTNVDIHSDKEIPSIAIIPFDNKGKEEDVFYAYGISSDLISDIANSASIKIASLKEIEALENIPFKDIAKKIFVRYIVSGTLWKMNNIFQLSVELYDTKKSRIIWSDRWQENWENLQNIKGNLTDGLLTALDRSPPVINKADTANTEAYEYYLRGKYKYAKRRNLEDVEIARGFLNRANELDNNLIRAKSLFGWTYFEVGEYDVAMKIYKDILVQSKNTNNLSSEGDILHNIAAIYWKKGQNEKAIQKLNLSLKIRIELGNQRKIANSYNASGAISVNIGKYQKALNLFKKSYSIYNKLNDDMGKVQALDNIAIIYSINCKYDIALKHCEKSIKIKERLEDQNGLSIALTNLGIIYYKIGDYEKSLEKYEDGLKISKKLNTKYVTSNLLDNIGIIFRNQDEFNKSIDSHYESLAIRKKLDDKIGIAKSIANIGITYQLMGNYKEAIFYLKKAFDKQNDINSNEILEVTIYLSLSYKQINKEYNDGKITTLIKKEKEIDFDLNYRIFELLQDSSYLLKSYSQIQEKTNIMENKMKIKFFNYPIPKAIVEEYNKVFKK